MELDMTKGNPSKIILKFFIPLFIGDLFQQLYSIIDAIIIGKFVGTAAFAAVGSSSAVTVFISSILLGLAMGASVIFSQLYGGKQYNELKKSNCYRAHIFILCKRANYGCNISVFATDYIPLSNAKSNCCLCF